MFQRLKQVIVWTGVFCLIFAANIQAKTDPLDGGEAVFANDCTVSFQSVHDDIIVTAKVNDDPKEYHFLMDTGAFINVVSEQFANTVGLKRTGQMQASDSSGTSQKVDYAILDTLKVGNVCVKNSMAIVIDFRMIESYGYKLDGIIGGNFLKFFRVIIDYDQKLISFDAPKGLEVDPTQKLGYSTDLFTNSQGTLIYVLLNLKGIAGPIRAEIDTGASGSNTYLLLPNFMFDQLRAAFDCDPIESKGNSSGGAFTRFQARDARLAGIECGGFQTSHLPVANVNQTEALLSDGFLSRFKVIIDYPAANLRLIPNGRTFENNGRGFGLSTADGSDGSTLINGIRVGSPADKAGLKPGDTLLYIKAGDQEISIKKWDDYRDKFEQLRVGMLDHDGKQSEVVLEKAALFPEVDPDENKTEGIPDTRKLIAVGKAIGIIRAYWAGEPAIAGVPPKYPNSFFVTIDKQITWDDTKEFRNKAGLEFELLAKGKPVVCTRLYQGQTLTIDGKKVNGFWLRVTDEELAKLETGTAYRMIPRRPNCEYQWVIPVDFRVRK